jgi:hypothetical protein
MSALSARGKSILKTVGRWLGVHRALRMDGQRKKLAVSVLAAEAYVFKHYVCAHNVIPEAPTAKPESILAATRFLPLKLFNIVRTTAVTRISCEDSNALFVSIGQAGMPFAESAQQAVKPGGRSDREGSRSHAFLRAVAL